MKYKSYNRKANDLSIYDATTLKHVLGPYSGIVYSVVNQETFLSLQWICPGIKLVYEIRMNRIVFQFCYFGLSTAHA